VQAVAAANLVEGDGLSPERLAAANINPVTRLATDYLNHFNNVVMLLEMIGDMPEMAEEIMGWQPCSYPDYFATSHFREKDLAVRAYHAADPHIRDAFDGVVAELDKSMAEAKAMLSLCEPGGDDLSIQIGMLVSERMKPLISEASGVINGRPDAIKPKKLVDTEAAQASIDELFP
jgi:hypothetical protein